MNAEKEALKLNPNRMALKGEKNKNKEEEVVFRVLLIMAYFDYIKIVFIIIFYIIMKTKKQGHNAVSRVNLKLQNTGKKIIKKKNVKDVKLILNHYQKKLRRKDFEIFILFSIKKKTC